MIKTELLKDDTLIRHYSDIGMKLLQAETGTMYDEAVDVMPCKYTYEETDKPIETTEEDILAENADMKSALNLLGVE
jgi:hypothetical protein